MRTLMRVGGILGCAGFVALYALQTATALAVVAGIPLVGLLAGLGAAKWLPREEYGRQLRAGLRAGLLACGLAALGALLSLLLLGPRDIPTLAARSNVVGLDLAPVVRTLALLTWAGVALLLVLLAAALGCGLAAISAQIAGWSKSAEAVRVVRQARLAAQALNRDDAWQSGVTGAPLPHSGQPVHASTLLRQLGVPVLGTPSASHLTGMPGVTGAPAFSGMPGPISAAGSTGALPVTGFMPVTGSTPGLGLTPPLTFTPGSGTPLPPFGVQSPQPAPAPASTPTPARDPEVANATEPALPAASAPAQSPDPAPSGKQPARRRSSSSRRRADRELTQAMREALAAWASENAAEAAGAAGDNGATRTPASSAYLNSAGPAPAHKRGRKKQDTQDWLC